MSQILQIKIRNSECRMPKERRPLLACTCQGLVPCDLKETEDECIFTFHTEGLYPFQEWRKLTRGEVYRLLANCAGLEILSKEYRISLSPDNLMIDINLCPKVLIRDQKEIIEKDEFLEQYQALAASVLVPKRSFDDYYNGGESIYRKKRVLKEIKEKNTVEGLQEYFLENYQNETEKVKKEKKLVRRSLVLAAKISVPVLSLALVASIYTGINMKYIQMPYQEKLLKAHTAYLSAEYVEVEDTLQTVAVDQLPLETKYILARSYIFTEGLTPAQRDNLLAGTGINTDSTIFDYWIELGRCEFEQAVDTAQRLGDDELLLYAYIKQSAYVKTDADMGGEEKAALISQLEGNINSMSESMAEAKAEAEEATRAALEIEETTGEANENVNPIQ